jgi:hypothetical protein
MHKVFALMTAVVVLIGVHSGIGQILVKGTVIDSLSSTALNGVFIQLSANGANTLTDAQGKFTLTGSGIAGGYSRHEINRRIGPDFTIKIFSQCGEVVRMYRGAESVTWPKLTNGIYVIEIERNGIKRLCKTVRMNTGVTAGKQVLLGDMDENTAHTLLKVAAVSDTIVATKPEYRYKRQAVTIGDTNVVIKMMMPGPILTLTGTTIYWTAITGTMDYHYAISNGPRSDVGRTTTYGDLGNVTSWTPPAVSGQTMYYGVEDFTHANWSANEVSIIWP